MRPFAELTARGQLRRLRGHALAALDRFPIDVEGVVYLGHAENTTFRVDARGPHGPDGPYVAGRYLLRLHRPGYQSREEVASELAWIGALRRDTGLRVPEPVGEPVVVDAPGAPAHVCTLLRWMAGSRLRAPAPRRYAEVGRVMAILHDHAARWTPPASFARRRWDWERLFGDPAAWDGLPAKYAPRVREVADRTRVVMDAIGDAPDVFGLQHADLHFWNVLFRRGEARIIDFDDCGYGHHLHDIGITLGAYRFAPGHDAARAAFLDAYTAVRGQPAHLEHLDAFIAAREASISLWYVERARESARMRGILDERLAQCADRIRRLQRS